METIKKLIEHGIQLIDRETADQIIDKRKPEGLFFTISNDYIIAIDNTSGDAFVEEFKTEGAAIMWMADKVNTEDAYKMDEKLSEAENTNNLNVKGLIKLLSGVNGEIEVRKENGMPVEKITIELNNSGIGYIKIC